MIKANNDICTIEGSAKDLMKEFTLLIVNLVDTLQRSFELTEEDAWFVIKKCTDVAFMSNDERTKFLKELMESEEE